MYSAFPMCRSKELSSDDLEKLGVILSNRLGDSTIRPIYSLETAYQIGWINSNTPENWHYQYVFCNQGWLYTADFGNYSIRDKSSFTNVTINKLPIHHSLRIISTKQNYQYFETTIAVARLPKIMKIYTKKPDTADEIIRKAMDLMPII